MSVLTVYVRAPSGCLLDVGGGVGKFLMSVGKECPLARARMGRDALAVLGDGGGVVEFLDVAGTIRGSGGKGCLLAQARCWGMAALAALGVGVTTGDKPDVRGGLH